MTLREYVQNFNGNCFPLKNKGDDKQQYVVIKDGVASIIDNPISISLKDVCKLTLYIITNGGEYKVISNGDYLQVVDITSGIIQSNPTIRIVNNNFEEAILKLADSHNFEIKQ